MHVYVYFLGHYTLLILEHCSTVVLCDLADPIH